MTEPADPEWLVLYREAFERFGVTALWSCRIRPDPTPGQARAISDALKRQGDLAAWKLAHRLREACDAA